MILNNDSITKKDKESMVDSILNCDEYKKAYLVFNKYKENFDFKAIPPQKGKIFVRRELNKVSKDKFYDFLSSHTPNFIKLIYRKIKYGK